MNYMDIAVIMLTTSFISLCIVYSYSIGLKHGKMIGHGVIPKIELNPIKAYSEAKEAKEAKETKVAQDKVTEGWNNIFNYDGTPQKKEGEES